MRECETGHSASCSPAEEVLTTRVSLTVKGPRAKTCEFDLLRARRLSSQVKVLLRKIVAMSLVAWQ
eukprot:scaffold149714_cov37-Tisochrysis_lutea.AAC.3